MLRSTILSACRASTGAMRTAVFARTAPISAPRMWSVARSYSSDNGLEKSDVEKRIIDVLQSFDKISDASKITPTATFAQDLSLDSLDTVEVLVAIEEEFNIEIPDNTADEIKSIDQAVEYILAQSEAV